MIHFWNTSTPSSLNFLSSDSPPSFLITHSCQLTLRIPPRLDPWPILHISFSSSAIYHQFHIYSFLLYLYTFCCTDTLKSTNSRDLFFSISPMKRPISLVFYSSLINWLINYYLPGYTCQKSKSSLRFSIHSSFKSDLYKLINKFCFI